MKMNPQTYVQFNVRLPPNLVRDVKEAAFDNRLELVAVVKSALRMWLTQMNNKEE